MLFQNYNYFIIFIIYERIIVLKYKFESVFKSELNKS